MNALFVVFATKMSKRQVNARRKRLIDILKTKGVTLHTIRAGTPAKSAVRQIIEKARPAPVIAIDDSHSLPEKADWFRDLMQGTDALREDYRPQVIYVSQAFSASGLVEAHLNPICCHYVRRDEKRRWVGQAADTVLSLVKATPQVPLSTAGKGTRPAALIGVSDCFCDAVRELTVIMQSSYGMVTGEVGVGKMFVIRSLWRQIGGGEPMVVLPCGSFFQDYYVGGNPRRVGGGRKAVDQIEPYLSEAQDGLLVLHHFERLPSALQETLAVWLQEAEADPDKPTRLRHAVKGGLAEYDVRILATSTFSPEVLKATGRTDPELLRRLNKRHVCLPPLRQRGKEDVRLVSEDILDRVASMTDALKLGLSQDAVSALGKSLWKENISGLVRVLEKASRKCRGTVITLKHLSTPLEESQSISSGATLDEVIEQAQRAAIQNALKQTGGDVGLAAAILGRNKHGLHRLMTNLGLREDRPKRRSSGKRAAKKSAAKKSGPTKSGKTKNASPKKAPTGKGKGWSK